MKRFVVPFVFAVLTVAVSPVSAHFLWLEAEPVEKPAKIHLWFSETTVPGEAKLLDKITHAKTWIVRPEQETETLTLQKYTEGDVGGWSAAIDSPAPFAVETDCDYGVISRGETFLLQYHAKHAAVGDAKELGRVSRSERLPLDVSAKLDDDSLVFTVQFEDKPAADAQLLVVTPDNEERQWKLDANGSVRFENVATGEYAARASVKLNSTGERNGKKYEQVRHYTTLTFHLPGETAANQLAAVASEKAAAKAADPAATELLQKARETRAVWDDFHGFTADIAVTIDGKSEKGTIEVDDTGGVTVKLADEKLRDWAETMAGSLVQHRMPSGFDDETVTFGDDQKDHPLGRLIFLGDKTFDSAYRIQDDVVTEVNRRAGKSRFTISVLETEWNKEHKYLPRVFTITTWDAESGQIKSSSSVLNTWTRVGPFDLPQRMLEVGTSPGDRKVREITFSNYKLTG